MTTTYLRYGAVRVADNKDDQKSASDILNKAEDVAQTKTQEAYQEYQLSQIKRIIFGDASGEWNDDFGGAGIRSLKELDEALDTVDAKYFIHRMQSTADIEIPSGQNWKVLSVAASEMPSRPIALNSTTAGLVAVQLGVGEFDAHSTSALVQNVTKNLVGVRIASTNDNLLSSDGRIIMALLQAEDTASDAQNPNDTVGGNRLQVSFVVRNPSTEDLEAANVADVEGKVVELLYPDRKAWNDLDEDAFLDIVPFADEVPQTAVTMNNAYYGGNTVNVVQAEGDMVTNLADDLTSYKVQRDGAAFLTLTRDDTNGDLMAVETDRMSVANTQSATWTKGMRVNTADGSIDIGHSAPGKISRSTSLDLEAQAGDLSLTATGASSDALVVAGRDVKLTDARFSALALSDASTGTTGGAAWISALNDPPSIVAAINRAAGLGGKDFRYGAKVHSGGTVSAGSNVAGGDFFDFTAQSGEEALVFYSDSAPSTQNVFVALNGRRLAHGDASTPNDVRLGTTPASGDLIFSYPIMNDDFIEAWCHISQSATA